MLGGQKLWVSFIVWYFPSIALAHHECHVSLIARFDRDASRYHAGVYKAKRGSLISQLHSSLSPLFLGQLKNLHKAAVTTFRTSVLEGVKGESYDFGEVVQNQRERNEKVFIAGASEALLEDTDWTYDDELDLLREDITHIADQCRVDETKKMITRIEVCTSLLSHHNLCK